MERLLPIGLSLSKMYGLKLSTATNLLYCPNCRIIVLKEIRCDSINYH